MEEIICPLCGKPNPADNKYCDFCLAYLEPQESQEKEAPKIPASDQTDQEGLGDHSSEAQTPEWLSNLLGLEASEDKPSSEESLGLELPAADTSDWMPGSSKGDSIPGEGGPAPAPFTGGVEGEQSEEIPPWLSDVLTEETAPESQPADDLEGISPDRIQPESPQVDRKTGGKTPRGLEDGGPLAGLSGVLSAEPGVARIRKPTAYSTKIRVSENQQEHVSLLQKLLEEEGALKPLPVKSPISQQNILRWGIAIVLFAAVLWSLVFSGEQAPVYLYDEGTAEVHRLINQLPENTRVLVGFDFEPGLAAELDATAAPVFDHLVEKGALFTLISTTPNGPILAERFVKYMLTENEYRSGLDYINLGYLPGGAAGLLNFIEDPPGMTPYSIDGKPIWSSENSEALPPVNGIDSITDYDMILLLADDPDNARIWIEQLSPYITDPGTLTSLALVTSAQLEPIVRPYFESIPQSVNGLVVGLRGGVSYSLLTGGEHLAGNFWDAFGLGTFIAALLILVGGLAYYVVPELSRTVRGQEKIE